MKNTLWVFLIIPLIANSQIVQIDSFMGIKFGVSKNEALLTAQQFGASLNSENGQEEVVILKSFKFAGIESNQTYLKFVDNQFFESITEFEVDESNFIEIYNALKLQLVDSYGYGKDFSWFAPPNYYGDGKEFNAIINKNGKLCHAWVNTKQITSANFIVLEVCPDRILRLVFQNHLFASMYSRRIRQISSAN